MNDVVPVFEVVKATLYPESCVLRVDVHVISICWIVGRIISK
jgi:hypothetical protein